MCVQCVGVVCGVCVGAVGGVGWVLRVGVGGGPALGRTGWD